MSSRVWWVTLLSTSGLVGLYCAFPIWNAANLMFGVTVDHGFRKTLIAQRIYRAYCLRVVATAVAIVLLFF
jgi:hypothetical protein